MRSVKDQLENFVIMKIHDGDVVYQINDYLLRSEFSKHMRDCDAGAIIGARDRLINKKFLTKRFELTEKGLKRCERIKKRQGRDEGTE